MHPHVSNGWPYDDCAVHVQVRARNKQMDLAEVRKECEMFGNILKVFPWTSKKSSTPQALVLFDSPVAVHRAAQSFLGQTSWLWKNGYHMLKMCESTHDMIQSFFKREGITRNDPMFDGIPTKSSKPWAPKKNQAVRGEQGPQTHRHSTPTGPRYHPYSLDSRPNTSTSAQATNSLSLPPKNEPSPDFSRKSVSRRRKSIGSPEHKFVPNKNWLKSTRSPSPIKPPITPNPSLPPVTSDPPLPPPSILRSPVDDVDQRQLNLKLRADIEELVSDHLDTVQRVYCLETDNRDLESELKIAESELSELRDTLASVQLQEGLLAVRLVEIEAERDGAQDACTQALAAIKDLLANQQRADNEKHSLRNEMKRLKRGPRAVPSQSQATSKRTVEVGVQAELARPAVEASIRAPAHLLRLLFEPVLQGASSEDINDAFAAPNVEHTQPYPIVKPDLHDIPGFVDVFNDIDILVREVFIKTRA